MNKFEKKEITKKSVDFSRWYNDVCLKAGLADYSPVRGCMVFKPYGFAIWKKMRDILEEQLVRLGHQEVYFPLFIPMSLFQKEKEHVKGFSPQLAVVTHGGGEKLAEALAVRPTSETIMYETYKNWIQSWRDLPMLYYSWDNVVRWEKRTYLFLRTSEFLWHEGHTVHATYKDALKEVMDILALYKNFLEEYLAMPALVGKKSKSEKFAGAQDTYTLECLMKDKKCLQGGTSHDLGQNFSKAFQITFQDKDGKRQYVWQTCWAVSTRLIGGLIMMHGDDDGLILPPKIAPIKVVIIPILGHEETRVLEFAKKVKKLIEEKKSEFSGAVEVWDRPEQSFGWRVNEAELKGIPLVIPIGLAEVRGKKVTISRRDGKGKLNEQAFASSGNIAKKVEEMLGKVQKAIFRKSSEFLQDNTYKVDNYDEFIKIMKTKKGLLKAFWCGGQECEQKIKKDSKASNRCLPLEAKGQKGRCICCGRRAFYRWFFAQAY